MSSPDPLWFGIGIMFDDAARFSESERPALTKALEEARDRKLAQLGNGARLVGWRSTIGPGKRGKPVAWGTCHYELLA